ncbi:MAG: M23 family metallopeptidase [Maricaulaceae bacterium]
MRVISLAVFAFLGPASADDAPKQPDCLFGVCLEVDRSESAIEYVVTNHNALLPFGVVIRPSDAEDAATTSVRPPVLVAPGERKSLLLRPRGDASTPEQRQTVTLLFGGMSARHDVEHVYRLPFRPGKTYRVSKRCHGGGGHQGASRFAVDFPMRRGTIVTAARAGRVVYVQEGYRGGGKEDRFRFRANRVIVEHADGSLGHYLHLKPNGVFVALGETVRAGDRIGRSGNTGWSSGPHLHFHVTQGGATPEEQAVPIRFSTSDGVVECPSKGVRLTANRP